MIGKDILKYLFKNYVAYIDDIPLNLFVKEKEKELFILFKEYFKEYNELPNLESFKYFLGKDYKDYIVLIDDIFSGEGLTNFIGQTLLEEIKLQKWRDSILKSVSVLDDPKDTKENMDKHFAEILKAKTYDIKEIEKHYELCDAPILINKKENVTTPFLKELEYMLEDGGFFSPQNITIMGGAKSFKTGLLLIMAVDWFKKGKHIFIADVENGVHRTTLRMMQTIMGYTKDEVRDNYDKCIEGYNYYKKLMGGSIMIKGYRQKVESVLNVELDIDNIPNYKPDVIIYDYLDIMGGKNADKRLNIQDNYYFASSLNKKYGSFSVTVSKITDKGMYKKVNIPQDIAEDKEKLYNSDAVFSLSRTRDDIENNEGRICPLAMRDGVTTTIPIEIQIDALRMKITYNEQAGSSADGSKSVGFEDFAERLGAT